FEVVRVTPVLPDIWLVEGRAYESIRIGDIVAAEVTIAPGIRELLQFQVINTTSYGALLAEMSEGLTGGLVLKGKHYKYRKEFRKAKFLVALPAEGSLAG